MLYTSPYMELYSIKTSQYKLTQLIFCIKDIWHTTLHMAICIYVHVLHARTELLALADPQLCWAEAKSVNR